MNVYFDTSAFVPLLISEPESGSFEDLWNGAHRISSTRVLFIEANSALERARRARRISEGSAADAMKRLERLWVRVVVIELDESLMLEASIAASRFGLRGFDSLHCAAAFQMSDRESIAASGDSRLNEAWSELGLATFSPEV